MQRDCHVLSKPITLNTQAQNIYNNVGFLKLLSVKLGLCRDAMDAVLRKFGVNRENNKTH